jgi:hypothetical protein
MNSKSIRENALDKRKSIKSYRKEQEQFIKIRNEVYEQQLQERRQSELDEIKNNKKYSNMSLFSIGKKEKDKKSGDSADEIVDDDETADNEKEGFFQQIRNKFNKTKKSKKSNKRKSIKRKSGKRKSIKR